MPSITKENYLKALYFIHHKDGEIALTELSKNLKVSMPSVNHMVKKLQEKGWVEYKKYKPLQLTKKGQQEAAMVIRKHRLTEIFLSKVMGFGWEEVHDIAEEMEHIKSEKLFDKMDELLGHPRFDPHGSPIPNKNGEVVVRDFKLLSECKVGDKVRLCSLADSSAELLLYLNSKKIQLGTQMTILEIEDFDQSMTVRYTGVQGISLSQTVCQSLNVESMNH